MKNLNTYLLTNVFSFKNVSMVSKVSTKRPFESISSSRQCGLRSVDRMKRSRHLLSKLDLDNSYKYFFDVPHMATIISFFSM